MQHPIEAEFHTSSAAHTALVQPGQYHIREPEKEELDSGLSEELELKPLIKRNVHTALR